MGAIQPIGAPNMPAVTRILARYDRQKLEAFLAVAIDLLDVMEGDHEAEPSTWPEAIAAREHDAGLPDDGEAAGDEQDTAWTEWQSRGRHKLKLGYFERADTMGHEDDEDDDPDTGVEDGSFDPEEDMCTAGDDGCGGVLVHGRVHWGAAEDGTDRLPQPMYGLDQSRGPISPH